MATPLPISVVIPVRNEARNIALCLEALGDDVGEILVVDSGSEDDTCRIAADCGARVIQFCWDGGFPKKRNWVLRHVPLAEDWVLFLDADECVTADFKREVGETLPGTRAAGFWLRYRNNFMGTWLRFGDPFRKLALFRKDAGEYERIDDTGWSHLDMEVHEHPVLRGEVGHIRAPILHRDFKGMEAYQARHEAYAEWEARRFLQLRETDWHRLTARQRLKYRLLEHAAFAPMYFLACYGMKLGFLDGRAGFWFAWHKMRYFARIRRRIRELRADPGEIPLCNGRDTGEDRA